jgi:hypothetical protein
MFCPTDTSVLIEQQARHLHVRAYFPYLTGTVPGTVGMHNERTDITIFLH